MEHLYSVENARRFHWSSVTRDLNPVRRSHLEQYLLGKRILDAGCGGGAYTDFLTARGLEVTGIDNHEEFLHIPRDACLRGSYVLGDITDLPFPDKWFDSSFCFDVLEHVDDKLAIQELARVTRRRIVVAVPKEDDVMREFGLTFFHYQDRTHLRTYTESSLRNLMSLVAYSNVAVLPELPVPMKMLVRRMIRTESTRPGIGVVSAALGRALALLPYREICTSLVAVVDLKNVDARGL